MQNPASFKDPIGSVTVCDDHIERSCRPEYADAIVALLDSKLYRDLVGEGKILAAEWDDARGSVRQPRVEHWTYPYEWTFSMLKDAALLTLEIEARALAAGYTLKDATAYNMTFLGGRPVFVDIYSFEPFQPSLVWSAYEQFSREFLNPLLLESVCGVGFQKMFRSNLNGIPTAELAQLLPATARLRPKLFAHVFLKQKFENRYGSNGKPSKLFEAAGVDSESLARDVRSKLVQKLKRLIASLKPKRARSSWSDYQDTRTYQTGDLSEKHAFVEQFFQDDPGQVLIDYGCHRGEFSLRGAPFYETVIATDSDAVSLDSFYHAAQQSPSREKLVLAVQDIANPSPGLGWAHGERTTFSERLTADSFLALALVHHLRFSANIPTALLLDYFAERHQRGIIEYVGLDDPMTQFLLRSRPGFDMSDYTADAFEAALQQRFAIIARQTSGPDRELFSLARKVS